LHLNISNIIRKNGKRKIENCGFINLFLLTIGVFQDHTYNKVKNNGATDTKWRIIILERCTHNIKNVPRLVRVDGEARAEHLTMILCGHNEGGDFVVER